MSDNPTCQDSFSSMFRRKYGGIFLYCGYHYKPVEPQSTCPDHNKQIRGGAKYIPVERNIAKKAVFVKESDGSLKTFQSITEAALFLGMTVNGLSNALKRGTKAKRH